MAACLRNSLALLAMCRPVTRTKARPQFDREPDVVSGACVSGDPPGLGRKTGAEQARGILVAALGMLRAHLGYGETRRAS